MTKSKRTLALGFAMGCSCALACSANDTHQKDEGKVGELALAVTLADATHDVAAFEFSIFEAGEGCDGTPVDSRVAGLVGGGLPAWLAAEGAGGDHPFADGLFVLEAGNYDVCATPLSEQGEPSAVCDVATGEVDVNEGATTEIVLISQCQASSAGIADIVATLNTTPQVLDLSIEPSKFINTCEEATITAQVDDADGDDVEVEWEVLAAPPGADYELDGDGPSATFSADTEGEYELQLTLTDVYDGQSELSFPIHVSGDCSADDDDDDDDADDGNNTGDVDLLPVPAFDGQDPIAYCDLDDGGLRVTVQNQGTTTAPATVTTVSFYVNDGTQSVDVPTPAIAPGDSVQLGPLDFPSGCYTPDCFFLIDTDPTGIADDADQSNDSAVGYCLG